MKYKNIMLCLVIFIIQSNIHKASAYDNEFVHQMINGKAIQQSLNFQNNLNFFGFKDIYDSVNKKEIWQWFYDGARLEDETHCRSKFHFHDPTKPWDRAGLSNTLIDTYCLDYRHRSSLVWAQNTDNMWTWQKARQCYVEALTTSNRDLKEQKFADTFRSLGQVMHLVADSSVPAHTRNDIHVFPFTIPGIGVTVGGPTFESWAQENYKNLSCSGTPIDKSIFSQAVYNSLTSSPVSTLWDQDKYTGSNPDITVTAVGLAEYSNANFFSEDTIFSDFSFPAWSSVVEYDEVMDATSGKARTYLRKIKDGEIINYLATTKWLYKYLPSAMKRSGLKLDEKVYAEYASFLIPRAVGYSAGLLDYFFRGVLEISAPDQYVYSIIDGSKTPQQFTHIKAKVMNATPGESIQNGTIQAVARYKVIPDYSPDLVNYPPDGTVMMDSIAYKYSVSLPITLIPEQIVSLNTEPTAFTFDFTGNEIPAGITDLTLQVIFKGTLGNETDIAVAVGMKDLHEPAHHIFWNLTDMFSLYVPNDDAYHLYQADQIRNDPYLLSLSGSAYIDPHPITLQISYMPESPPVDPVYISAQAEELPDGRYVRLIVLTDDELTHSFVRMAWLVNLPDRESENGDNEYYFEEVVNQEYNGAWPIPTEATVFRTVTQHFHRGVLRCQPVAVDPVTGNRYCAYPEEEAIFPSDLSPYPAEILF